VIAKEHLSRDRMDELLKWVRNLDEQDDISPLFSS
jgi:hypothetical protein